MYNHHSFFDVRRAVFCLCVAALASCAVFSVAQAQELPGFSYDTSDFFNFSEPVSDEETLSPAEQAAVGAVAPAVPGGDFSAGGGGVPAVGLPPGLTPTADALSGDVMDAVKEETRRQAFDAAIEGMMPLRPEEIRTLLERYDRTQESVELPVYPAPRPQIAVETLSLDPSSPPKTVRVSHGYVTTFTVVDSTGAPWPIEDITWAGDFEIIESGEEGSHFIRITPRSPHAFGNMSMRLVGLQTPLILSVQAARDVVHYRFDAIVPQIGPFAEAQIIDSGISTVAGDSNLSRALEGGIPFEAKKLAVSGADARTSAFSLDGMVYLRTPLTLLSPSWHRSTSSSDGMRVYALSDTPVVLLSDQGRMVRVRLSAQGEF